METRKRTRRKEIESKAFETYLRLKEMPQGSCIQEDILGRLVRNMELKKEVPATLLGIIEVLRINAPRCFLSRDEKSMFFGLLVEALPRDGINLETFIAYRIPSLLTDSAMARRLVGLLSMVSGTAKRYLKEIAVILIEEGGEDMVKEVVKAVLLHIPKDPAVNSIIEATRDISMPIVAVVMEGLEDKIYTEIYSQLTLRSELSVRNVRGPSRVKYLAAAMSEDNFKKLCPLYIGDRDKRIARILAANCSPKDRETFHRILNDSDEGVRTRLLEKVTFGDVVEFEVEIHERILDSSREVRELVFNILRSGMALHRNSLLEAIEGPKENKPSSCQDGGHEAKCLLRFIRFVLKGVLTRERSEYVDLLNEFDLPWEFYFRIRGFKGTDVFLELNSQQIKKEEGDVPLSPEIRRFYLKHFFSGELPKEHVAELIRTDVMSALAYLQGRDLKGYVNHLLDKALACNDLEEILAMVDAMKPYLQDMTYTSCPKSSGELLVYAHSKYCSCFVAQVLDLDVSFPMLYFLAHMKVPIDTLLPLLLEYRGSSREYVEVQLAYNDRKLLQEFVDYFMEVDLDDILKKKLIGSRTLVGLMIYFLNTGQVGVRNTDFFIRSIHLVWTGSSNEAKARQIYETYAMRVDQDTFNKFYTVCSRLRGMSLSGETHEIVSGKMVKRSNKILLAVCDAVLGVREGELVDEKFNLELFHQAPQGVGDTTTLGSGT